MNYEVLLSLILYFQIGCGVYLYGAEQQGATKVQAFIIALTWPVVVSYMVVTALEKVK